MTKSIRAGVAKRTAAADNAAPSKRFRGTAVAENGTDQHQKTANGNSSRGARKRAADQLDNDSTQQPSPPPKRGRAKQPAAAAAAAAGAAEPGRKAARSSRQGAAASSKRPADAHDSHAQEQDQQLAQESPNAAAAAAAAATMAAAAAAAGFPGGSLPNIRWRPHRGGQWDVTLGAQALRSFYVGIYSTIGEAIHARDVAVLAIHGCNSKFAQTIQPAETYTEAEVLAARMQFGKKDKARNVMITNSLWPVAVNAAAAAGAVVAGAAAAAAAAPAAAAKPVPARAGRGSGKGTAAAKKTPAATKQQQQQQAEEEQEHPAPQQGTKQQQELASAKRASKPTLKAAAAAAAAAVAGADAAPSEGAHQQRQQSKKVPTSKPKPAAAGVKTDAELVAAAAAAAAGVLRAAEKLAAENQAKQRNLAKLQQDARGPTGTGNPAAATGAAAAAAAAAAAGKSKPNHKDLTKLDPRVEAAVEAAGLPRLKSRPGRLVILSEVLEIPDVSVFRIGDQTGHHAKLYVYRPDSDAPAEKDAKEAKASGPVEGNSDWVQVTVSCHDCQYQHAKWLCPCHLHNVTKTKAGFTWHTLCSRCVVYRYAGTNLSMLDLHKMCPQCRGCCNCKACLNKHEHQGQVEERVAGAEEQKRTGIYLVQMLRPHVNNWLQKQITEALAAGYEDLSMVPVAPLADQDKAYCDRCSTNVIGLSAKCESCGSEYCLDCLCDLRKHEQGLPAQQQQEHPGRPSGVARVAFNHVAGFLTRTGSRTGAGSNSNSAAAGPSGSNGAAAVAAAAAGSSGSRAGQKYIWHCPNPRCGQAPKAESEEAEDDQEDGQQQQDKQQDQQLEQDQQHQRSMSGGQCWCIPGNQELELQLVLPGDLCAGVDAEDRKTQAHVVKGVLAQLQDISSTPERELTIYDCPLLPLEVLPLLPLLDTKGREITLQQLESEKWWEVLPEPYRNTWRRHAGMAGVDKWLYTPAFGDLQVPRPPQTVITDGEPSSGSSKQQEKQLREQREAYEAQLLHCGLALVLFWARWRRGEPIIVRESKGRIPWDPNTMWRATKETKDIGAQTGRVVAQDCLDFHELPPESITAAKFFAGYSNGIWQQYGRLITGPLPKGSVAILPEAARTAAPAAAAVGGGSAALAGATAAAVGGAHSGSSGSGGSARGRGGSSGGSVGGSAGAAAAVAAADAKGACIGPGMLKVKDWPPTDDFAKEMPRHFMDFLERMSVPWITNPRLGRSPLNLASMLQLSDNPTDLGPKCYLAYGRQQEAESEGDSVTKLHKDMTDAVNILVEQEAGGDEASRKLLLQLQQGGAAAGAAGTSAAAAVAAAGPEPPAVVAKVPTAVRCGDAVADKPGYDGAGAVWDIYARGSDTDKLSHWLADNASSFVHQGKPVTVQFSSEDAASHAPIMAQKFMLVERHRQQLLQDTGVSGWHFEQHLEECVYIPGGCPHQVRNLMSCSKVAVDFVSPEAVPSALQQHGHLRTLDLAHGNVLKDTAQERDHAEKLQSHLLLFRGSLTAHGMTAEPQALLLPVPDNLQSKVKPSRRGKAAAAGAAATGEGSADVKTAPEAAATGGAGGKANGTGGRTKVAAAAAAAGTGKGQKVTGGKQKNASKVEGDAPAAAAGHKNGRPLKPPAAAAAEEEGADAAAAGRGKKAAGKAGADAAAGAPAAAAAAPAAAGRRQRKQ